MSCLPTGSPGGQPLAKQQWHVYRCKAPFSLTVTVVAQSAEWQMLARDQDRGWVRTHGCGLLGHAAGKALDPDVPHLATLRLLLARPTLAATAAVMARCLLLLRLRDSRRFCCTGDSSHLLLSVPQSHTTNRAGPSPKSKGVYGEVPSRGN